MDSYERYKKYHREYIRDWRKGIRRLRNTKEIHDKIKQDRLNGDDIYIIGLRYGYHPCSIARICQDLPIKKHVNRHKLFWSK